MYKLVCTRGVVNFCCSPSFLLILLSFIPCFIFHYPNIVISTVLYDFVLILFCLGSLSPRFFRSLLWFCFHVFLRDLRITLCFTICPLVYLVLVLYRIIEFACFPFCFLFSMFFVCLFFPFFHKG